MSSPSTQASTNRTPAVSVEDVVVITDDGYENLTEYPREFPVV